MSTSLPIDEIVPSLVASLALDSTRVVVVEAPPGAGKTTRLPVAFLNQPWVRGEILVSEPRRIAARLAAQRVAEELGQPLGEQVGYRVRFEDKTSARTKLVFVTEGLLLSQLFAQGKGLAQSVIFLDEVHERSSDLDTILALLRHALSFAPGLKIVAMSATLDADRLVKYFGPDTLRFVSEGRSYPVSLSYAARPDERPLPLQVRSAVKDALNRPGDILVFLPGSSEIRACEAALSALSGVRVQSIHGDLPLAEQAKIVYPSSSEQRVILATNIAESSLTIPGVTTVIDSGLARAAVFDPWSGVSRLETVPISQARAIQRAGRAGRVSEGHAVRLYTLAHYSTRPAQDTPELLRADLSELLLQLKAHSQRGGPSVDEIAFIDPPQKQAWEQAKSLLEMLGAIDQHGLTALGDKMSRLSLRPRLSRCIVGASSWDLVARTCLGAALLEERDIVLSARRSTDLSQVQATDSDLDERIDLLLELATNHFDRRLARDLDLDIQTALQVEKSARALYAQARNLLRGPGSPRLAADFQSQLRSEPTDVPLARVFLPGYIDRVAQLRGSGRELVLQSGSQATLSPLSGVTAPLFLALSMDAPGGRARKPVVRVAVRLDPDWLFDLEGDWISATDEVYFEVQRERVESISRLCFGKLVLDESKREASPGPECARILADALIAKGPAFFDPDGKLSQSQARLQLLLRTWPELRDKLTPIDSERWDDLAGLERELQVQAVRAAASCASNLAQVLEQDLVSHFTEILPVEIAHAMHRDTPASVRLGGGLTVDIHYEKDRPPWIEARLQNFFSMTETPRICGGRVALQIHLLSPNHRAVQVTSDLAGFWERHYPDLRKQLMRRYPKHLWPEDGRTASAPSPGRIR